MGVSLMEKNQNADYKIKQKVSCSVIPIKPSNTSSITTPVHSNYLGTPTTMFVNPAIPP